MSDAVSKKCRCGAEFFPNHIYSAGVVVETTRLCYSCIESDRTVDRQLNEAELVFDRLIQDATKFGWYEHAILAFEAKAKTSLLRLKRRLGAL